MASPITFLRPSPFLFADCSLPLAYRQQIYRDLTLVVFPKCLLWPERPPNYFFGIRESVVFTVCAFSFRRKNTNSVTSSHNLYVDLLTISNAPHPVAMRRPIYFSETFNSIIWKIHFARTRSVKHKVSPPLPPGGGLKIN